MLKNLKSLFIVEEDSQVKNEQGESKDQTTSQESNIKKPASSVTKSVTSETGNIDQKIVEKLLQAIEKNNLEGFDYLEYKKSLKALEKMPMDEATKYRSAFATASTMGVTFDKLLETTKFYIGVLNKENQEFSNTFKNQFNDKVSGREREIEEIGVVVKEKSSRIKTLTDEIIEHEKQIQILKNKLEESNAKIIKTQSDFKQSYDHLKSQLEGDIVKMQKYLK